MTPYDRVADLPVEIEGIDLEPRERETSSGFTRTTTVIALHGPDETGYGEDVTYDDEDHHALVADPPGDLAGEYAFDEFSATVGDRDLFPGGGPGREDFRDYRRWGFESAALDLALKQVDESLADRLDRSYDPVRFVVSTRLGDPPTADRVERWLSIDPALEFKLDATDGWTPGLVDRLADTGAVRVVDLKGQYEGTTVDQPPDPDLYRTVLEGLPDVLVEDPALTDDTRPVFEGHEGRVTWDAPIHGVESIEALPWEPEWLNVKPSRFGSVESLFETIGHCRDSEIRMFGGGQFELHAGRQHLHALASLFYPDAPNDVAPREYNVPEVREGLPSSPLPPPENPRGLEWQSPA